MEKHTIYKITDEQAKKFLDGLQQRKMGDLDELKRKLIYFFPAIEDKK